jgi:hypothetical protein
MKKVFGKEKLWSFGFWELKWKPWVNWASTFKADILAYAPIRDKYNKTTCFVKIKFITEESFTKNTNIKG